MYIEPSLAHCINPVEEFISINRVKYTYIAVLSMFYLIFSAVSAILLVCSETKPAIQNGLIF